MTLEIFIQILLFVTGVGGFYLIAKQNHYSIYGYWIGVFTQPIWFASAYLADQWGVIAMIPFYAYGHYIGIKNFHEK
jgi:hypothetical protein